MTPLPQVFLDRPLAHRGLHGVGRPENSLAAFRAAIEAGYGIELDLQISADGAAMVFHDDYLDRLTDETGPINARNSHELAEIPLLGGDDGIPTLADVLHLTDARAPLLIELKDQDGAFGDLVGPLETAVADTLDGYDGPIALMSFNPHSVAALADLCPGTPRGITTAPFTDPHSAHLPKALRADLAAISTFGQNGEAFISHQHDDLASPRVAEVRATGAAVLCWTIRSPAEEKKARKIAHNITFEGYLAAIP